MAYTLTKTWANVDKMTDRWSDLIDVTTEGVTGDGSTDDSSAIQALLDAGTTNLYFPSNTYRINSGLTIPSNSRIYAPDATFVAATAQEMAIYGTAGSASNLYASANKGDISVQVATKALFNVDDWVVVQDTQDVHNNSTKGQFQQLAQVISIDTSDGSFDELTLDRACAVDYTKGSSVPAKVTEITTVITDVWADFGTFGSKIRGHFGLAKDSYIKARATDLPIKYMPDEAAAQATDNMTFDFFCDYEIGGGPTNPPINIYGAGNSTFKINSVGGATNAVQIYNSANVNVVATVRAAGARSMWAYRTTGMIQVTAYQGMQVTAGNYENILSDHCEDLVWVSPRLYGWQRGDAFEVRSRNLNVKIYDIGIYSDNAVDTRDGLNIHGNGSDLEVDVIGGYIQGGGWNGCIVRETCTRVLIQGLKVEPHPDEPSTFIPLHLGETMDTYGDQENITIRDCVFISEGIQALYVHDDDGAGNTINNLLIDNVVLDYMTTEPPSQVIRVDDTVNAVLRGINYRGAADDQEFRIVDNTTLYAETDSWDLGGGTPTWDDTNTTYRDAGPRS